MSTRPSNCLARYRDPKPTGPSACGTQTPLTRPAPKETWALTMRWHDPATATDIPDYDQSRAEAQAERTRADAVEHEARARTGADQRRIAELEGQLRRLREGR